MSGQNRKWAERVWDASWAAIHDEQHSTIFIRRRTKAITIIAAALAHARREDYREGYREGMEEGLRQAARLRAKEESHEPNKC
jgi:flagellar biosynthesis/type III secretory pathway protein FliH